MTETNHVFGVRTPNQRIIFMTEWQWAQKRNNVGIPDKRVVVTMSGDMYKTSLLLTRVVMTHDVGCHICGDCTREEGNVPLTMDVVALDKGRNAPNEKKMRMKYASGIEGIDNVLAKKRRQRWPHIDSRRNESLNSGDVIRGSLSRKSAIDNLLEYHDEKGKEVQAKENTQHGDFMSFATS